MRKVIRTTKRNYLKLFGVVAVFAVCLLNLQFSFKTDGFTGDVNLVVLGSLSAATPTEPGTGGGKCKAELDCGAGKKVSCEGTNKCEAYSWYVECDGTSAYCR